MGMTIDIEAQVLRDYMPLTRPTRAYSGLASFEPGSIATWKLFPGASATSEKVAISVVNLGYIQPQWVTIKVALSVDEQVIHGERPGQLFIDSDPAWTVGGWSCVIHLPVVSDKLTFRGIHTVLLRSIVGPAVKR